MIDFDDPVKQKKKEYKLIKSETPLSKYIKVYDNILTPFIGETNA